MPGMPSNRTMITVIVPIDNPISQEFYDSVINFLQLHQLVCPYCKQAGCMTVHGYYKRCVRIPDGPLSLKVMRVKCTLCKTTHAILLSSIVPYSQIRLSDQQQIAAACEEGGDRNAVCDNNPYIDENTVKAVARRYFRHWRERLRSALAALSPIPDLIRKCFAVYSLQFMQIRRTLNRLHPCTT